MNHHIDSPQSSQLSSKWLCSSSGSHLQPQSETFFLSGPHNVHCREVTPELCCLLLGCFLCFLQLAINNHAPKRWEASNDVRHAMMGSMCAGRGNSLLGFSQPAWGLHLRPLPWRQLPPCHMLSVASRHTDPLAQPRRQRPRQQHRPRPPLLAQRDGGQLPFSVHRISWRPRQSSWCHQNRHVSRRSGYHISLVA